MSRDYKDPFGKPYTHGTLAEERYYVNDSAISSDSNYYCPGCRFRYRTYYTFSVPGNFMNTPNRWSCPLGCMYSSFHKNTPIPVELVGRCNLNKQGKNCYVKYIYVPHVEPNYAALHHNDPSFAGPADPLQLYDNHSRANYLNNIKERQPYGAMFNKADKYTEDYLEHFRTKNVGFNYISEQVLQNNTLENFSAPSVTPLANDYKLLNDNIANPSAYTNSLLQTTDKVPKSLLPITPDCKNNNKTFYGRNYMDNNYYGYMNSVDWNKYFKQSYPNMINIWY